MRNRLLFLALLVLAIPKQAISRPHRQRQPQKPDIHQNVLTVNASIGGIEEVAWTYGLEYERFLTPQSRFSIDVAASAYRGSTLGKVSSWQTRVNLNGYYIAPGLRYHPLKNYHLADPSIGAALLLGYEKRSEYHYGSSTYSGGISTKDEQFLGALLGQLSVNLHKYKPNKYQRIPVFGFFLSGGYIFCNTKPAEGYGNYTTHKYVQFGLRFGGHW